MAELMIKIDPDYRNCALTVSGKLVLYVLLKKALYGTLKAALLFWKRLKSKLESWGFILNPYDSFVANKVINGKQCTIVWHVDDLKISYVDADVANSVISLMEGELARKIHSQLIFR
jgi:hypothetical protein